MSTKRASHSQFQSYLLLGLSLFFVGHFLLLSPSTLEDDFGGMRVIEPKDLMSFLKNEPKSLVPNLPIDVLPAYSLRDTQFYATDGIEPNLKMTARKSNLYQKEQLMHARDVVVELADHTLISSKEAVFFLEKNQINLFGSVHIVFQNGVEIDSEIATFYTKPVAELIIAQDQLVQGRKIDGNRSTNFVSYGLTYTDSALKELHLLSQVKVELRDDKTTEVVSDHANYQSQNGQLYFFMNESRPLSQQFVKVKQPDLDMKSRKIEVVTGKDRSLATITAVKDVLIRDSHDPKRLAISTSGRAVYYQKNNDVLLSDFPQVYQEGDTITGDTITFHRKTDLIEVKQSNAIYNNSEPGRLPR